MEQMITIVARNLVKPGMRNEFLMAVEPLIAASRAESGNISYDLYEDVANPSAFCFIEQWRDADAVALHNASSHFAEWMGKKADWWSRDRSTVTLRPDRKQSVGI